MAKKKSRRKGRPYRGGEKFPATVFVRQAVGAAGIVGIRPRDIVEKIKRVAPGHHVRPSALVSTILYRLKRKGLVTRREGWWYPKLRFPK